MGRIHAAHGLRGQVRVEALTDNPDRFRTGERLRAGDRDLTVSGSQSADRGLLIAFAEIRDRTAAEALAGRYLEVPAASLPPPPPGAYYHFQLVGLHVQASDGADLGMVEEVISMPANDVLRLSGGALLPMTHDAVAGIDLEAGVLRVRDWVEP